MDFTTLDIILIIIAAILIAVVIFIKINTKKYIIRATRRIDDHYSSLLNKSYNENRRINTLYNELKNQSAAQKSTTRNANASHSLKMERLAAEQVNLQAQQDELASRNRQLWDMSVTIEKERQHIQSLKTKIEAQHHSVTSSIRYAKQIQTAALPSEDVLNNAFKDFFLFWRPREIVSGDFYWMKRMGNNLIFTIADCTGHGVPGGFMSMLTVAFLNDICVDFTSETTPAHILEQLRNKVIITLKHQDDEHVVQKDGIDMGICILNLDTNKMQFAGADNGMYHVRGNILTEYKPVRNPIGEYPRMVPFENYDVDIRSGDYIYLFTDGFTDQLDPENHKYTPRQLRQLLIDINSKTKVAAEQLQMLDQELNRWRQGVRQMDDILIGGYCIK